MTEVLPRIFGLTPPGYDAHLPPVALSRAGSTEFHLAGLPPGHYRYEFSLTGGSIYGDRRNDPVHPPPWASHANTEISFRATAPNGTTLYRADFRLKDLEWYPYVRSMYPEIHSELPVIAAADFTLTVTVRHPSTAPREKLIISGFAEDAGPVASSALR